eukprot:4568673-Amphidinium_carterae.1
MLLFPFLGGAISRNPQPHLVWPCSVLGGTSATILLSGVAQQCRAPTLPKVMGETGCKAAAVRPEYQLIGNGRSFN